MTILNPEGLPVEVFIGRDQSIHVTADHYERRGTVLGYDIALVADAPEARDV